MSEQLDSVRAVTGQEPIDTERPALFPMRGTWVVRSRAAAGRKRGRTWTVSALLCMTSFALGLVLLSMPPEHAIAQDKEETPTQIEKDLNLPKDVIEPNTPPPGKPGPNKKVKSCKGCEKEAEALQTLLDAYFIAALKASQQGKGPQEKGEQQKLEKAWLGDSKQRAEKQKNIDKKKGAEAPSDDPEKLKEQIKKAADALKKCLDRNCPPKAVKPLTPPPEEKTPTTPPPPPPAQPPAKGLPPLPVLPDGPCWKDAAEKKKFQDGYDKAFEEYKKLRAGRGEGGTGEGAGQTSSVSDEDLGAWKRKLDNLMDKAAEKKDPNDCPPGETTPPPPEKQKEKPKENKMELPGEPSTPVPESPGGEQPPGEPSVPEPPGGEQPPRETTTPLPQPPGFGVVLPPPMFLPGEVPGREEVKEKTDHPKRAGSQEKLTKPKKKHKTAVRRAKPRKPAEPGSPETVKKPSETGTRQESTPAKRPTSAEVKKSLKAQDTGGLERKPEMKGRTTTSTRKKVSGKSGTTKRKGGQTQEKSGRKRSVSQGQQTEGQGGKTSPNAPRGGGKGHR